MSNETAMNNLTQSELKGLVNYFNVEDWKSEDGYDIDDISSDLYHAVFMKVWAAAFGNSGEWGYNFTASDDMTIGEFVNCAIGEAINVSACDMEGSVSAVLRGVNLNELTVTLSELNSRYDSDYLIENDVLSY